MEPKRIAKVKDLVADLSKYDQEMPLLISVQTRSESGIDIGKFLCGNQYCIRHGGKYDRPGAVDLLVYADEPYEIYKCYVPGVGTIKVAATSREKACSYVVANATDIKVRAQEGCYSSFEVQDLTPHIAW